MLSSLIKLRASYSKAVRGSLRDSRAVSCPLALCVRWVAMNMICWDGPSSSSSALQGHLEYRVKEIDDKGELLGNYQGRRDEQGIGNDCLGADNSG